MNILVNGIAANQVNCSDRGLQYGDGLFETIACKAGKLLLWKVHMKRLQQGCERLNIPAINAEIWLEDIRKLVNKNENCVIKLIITRGESGRGYVAPTDPIPTRIVTSHPWPNYPSENVEKGIRVRVCHTQISVNLSLAGLKHLNRLDNVLARNEWADESFVEGLMLDDQGYVIEGTMSNIFAVKNDVMYTPMIKRSGVKGVMRTEIIHMASQNNIKLIETDFKLHELVEMDELFMTNSIIGIWPVHELEGHSYSVGPLTQFMLQKLNMENNYYAL